MLSSLKSIFVLLNQQYSFILLCHFYLLFLPPFPHPTLQCQKWQEPGKIPRPKLIRPSTNLYWLISKACLFKLWVYLNSAKLIRSPTKWYWMISKACLIRFWVYLNSVKLIRSPKKWYWITSFESWSWKDRHGSKYRGLNSSGHLQSDIRSSVKLV